MKDSYGKVVILSAVSFQHFLRFCSWRRYKCRHCFVEYVQKYVEYLLNGAIYRQFEAFYHGFHSVCASNALIVSSRCFALIALLCSVS